MTIAASLEARGVDILENVISGFLVVVIAFGAWYLKEIAVARRTRGQIFKNREARLALLQDELATIVSFTEKCTVAASAREQFAGYQHWLTANGLVSWKQNRLTVQTWMQPTGLAEEIRMGQVPIAADVVDHLVEDMRKTEFPIAQDNNFRWNVV